MLTQHFYLCSTNINSRQGADEGWSSLHTPLEMTDQWFHLILQIPKMPVPLPLFSYPHGAFFLPYIQLDFFFLQIAPRPFTVNV